MIYVVGIRLFAIGAGGRGCLIFSIEELGSARWAANQFGLGTFIRARFTGAAGTDRFMNRAFVSRKVLSAAAMGHDDKYPSAQDDKEQGDHGKPKRDQSRIQGGHLSEYFSRLCPLLSQESCQPLFIH
ncbi:MAG: hypothetical protein SCH72_14360 [Desulfuromonadales bacterium]|nr:hypothetical protein [Desulfuromonadales bacterium]